MIENLNNPINYLAVIGFAVVAYYLLRISKLWDECYKEETKK